MSIPIVTAVGSALLLVLLGDLRDHARLAAGVMVLWGVVVVAALPAQPARRGLLWVALALRALLLFSPPTLSDDVFRYVWEGQVWRAGFHPFVYPPDDPALAALRGPIWEQVNHRGVSSIYPPLAQGLFVLLNSGGTFAWKLMMGLADVGTALLLARRDLRAGWLWALLPLTVVESAGSGHLEGVGVLCLVAALGGRAWAAWAGAMIKLLPGFLMFPLVGRSGRAWAGWVGLSALVSLPLLTAGPALLRGFETYRQTWAYNASIYSLVGLLLPEATTRLLLQLVGAALSGWILVRSRDPGRVALWTTSAFVVLSPTVHPWYVLWPLAAGLWGGVGAWTWLAALMPLSYLVLDSYNPETSTWVEPLWTRPVIYLPFYALLLIEGWRRWTRPGPWPVH